MNKLKKKNKVGRAIINGLLSFAANATIKSPILAIGVGVIKGVVTGVKKNRADNLNAELGGRGSVDISGLIGAITGVVLVLGGTVAVAKGWITTDDLAAIMDIFNSIQ